MFRKNIAVFTLGLVLALASVMANATVIVRIADDGIFGNEVFEQISPTPTTYIFVLH